MIKAGSLNRRVLLQSPGAGVDSIGQATQAWTTVATVWANIRTLSGVETIRAGAESSTVKASIRIRRRADVNSGWRVLLGDTVYQVNAVRQDEEARDATDLVCEVIA